ncbi:hypothetical protein V8G54_021669 [Vigna mungo]|uniref:Uncharacterized protein n=1 Tax=Vigna mungo TaxID=3915 RepID=A0AAQ3NGJ5_VIGMU
MERDGFARLWGFEIFIEVICFETTEVSVIPISECAILKTKKGCSFLKEEYSVPVKKGILKGVVFGSRNGIRFPITVVFGSSNVIQFRPCLFGNGVVYLVPRLEVENGSKIRPCHDADEGERCRLKDAECVQAVREEAEDAPESLKQHDFVELGEVVVNLVQVMLWRLWKCEVVGTLLTSLYSVADVRKEQGGWSLLKVVKVG